MSGRRGIDLHRRIAELAREVQYSRNGIDGALHRLAAAATELVPGARHADITQVGKRLRLQMAASAGAHGEVLAGIMIRSKVSPCADVINGRQSVVSADLQVEDRWAAYCEEVCDETPIRTVLSMPLLNHSYILGVLNLYAETPGALDLRSMAFATSYASHAAIAWESLRREDQFASALASRDTIGQAKGILMERFELDAEGAFGILRQVSQESNTVLATVARDVVHSQTSPSAGSDLAMRAELVARLRSRSALA